MEYSFTAPYNADKHIEMLKETWNEYMTSAGMGDNFIKPRFLHQDGKLTFAIQAPLPIPGFSEMKVPYKLQ